MGTPGAAGLRETVDVLRRWQHDRAPVQLHPGDLGWYWRFGADATAAAVRTWSRDGQILAIGLLDGLVSSEWRLRPRPTSTMNWGENWSPT